jgi:uncharacterized protein YjbJ (UPF0337 family)
MNEQHAKGTLARIRGRIEEALGRLTGNRRQQVGGVAHQVEGDVRHGIGDVQETVKRHEDQSPTG